MPFSYPIEHVSGSNGIYQRNLDWELPEADQKYLKNGILFIPFTDPYLVNDASGSSGEWSRRLLEITGAGVRLANNINRILEMFNGGGLD